MSQAITARQLDDRAVLQYKEDGFLIVRGVFTADEIHALDAEAERLSATAANSATAITPSLRIG